MEIHLEYKIRANTTPLFPILPCRRGKHKKFPSPKFGGGVWVWLLARKEANRYTLTLPSKD
jgi:hypothetical protein